MGMWDTPTIIGYTPTPSGGYVPTNSAPAATPSWYADAYAAGIDPTSTGLTYTFKQDPTGQLAQMKAQAAALAQQQGRAGSMSAADLAGAQDWAKQYILAGLGLGPQVADNYNGWKANTDNGALMPYQSSLGAGAFLSTREQAAKKAAEVAAYQADPTGYLNSKLAGIKNWTVGGNDNQQFTYDARNGNLVNAVKKNTDESQMALAALAATGLGAAAQAGLLGAGAATTGAVASPVAAGTATATDLGLLGSGGAATGAATTGLGAIPEVSLTAPSLAGGTAAAGMGGGTGLGIGAATDGVGIGATTAGGLSSMGGGTGLMAAGTGAGSSIFPSLSSIGSALKDNASLVGAGLGALAGSQNSQQTTNASKEPWGPAQAWLKANLGLGQQLQDQYMKNPFSQFQQQAYNNSAALGNAGRANIGSLIGQMGQRQAFNPRMPNVVQPYQFNGGNLGFNTSTPFPGA